MALYLHQSRTRLFFSYCHCYFSSVSTVGFEHVFVFWVWSFNISITFTIRWIQDLFIYRRDFLKVKYLREVACTAPWLFIFQNLFKISKPKCVKSTFAERHLLIIETSFSRAKVHCHFFRVEFHGRSFVWGWLFREKLFKEKCLRAKVHGATVLREISRW